MTAHRPRSVECVTVTTDDSTATDNGRDRIIITTAAGGAQADGSCVHKTTGAFRHASVEPVCRYRDRP